MAATSTTSLLLFLLMLLLLQSPASITAEPPSSANAATPDTSVSPPLAAVMIVLVGAFFLSGLVFVAIRHIIDSGCCRFLTGGRAVGGGGGARRQVVAEGLRQEAVQAIPTYFYKDVKMHRLVGKGELECAVCLNEFQDLEALRLMPECSHVFHPECVDPWLMSQATCPVCRTVIKPTSNNLALDEHVITIDHDVPLGPESMEIPKPHSTNGEDDRITLRLPKEIRGYRARITWCGQAQATHQSSESELAPPLSDSSGAAHVEVA